jgi:hypothetical protein
MSIWSRHSRRMVPTNRSASAFADRSADGSKTDGGEHLIEAPGELGVPVTERPTGMILFKPPRSRHAFRRTRPLKIFARVRHSDRILRITISGAPSGSSRPSLQFSSTSTSWNRCEPSRWNAYWQQRTGRFPLCTHVARTIGISTESLLSRQPGPVGRISRASIHQRAFRCPMC